MWEINNFFQWITFGRAIIFGMILCLFYDILRFFRGIFGGKVLYTFFTDLFFWIAAAFLTFCFYLSSTNGQTRLYVLFGIFIGATTFKLTLSRLITVVIKPVRRCVLRVGSKYNRLKLKAKKFSFKSLLRNRVDKIVLFLDKKRKIS